MMTSQNHKIYLASKSPRRRELLKQIGVQFELLALDVPEIAQPNEAARDYVMRITHTKAQAAWGVILKNSLPFLPVLAADTAVVLDGVIYGKPQHRDEAYAMITHLSGRTHQVLTGVAVHYHQQQLACTHISDVTFCSMSKDQIDRYCDTQEPYDKAGSYAIQGIAAQFISHISGSYSGIMGLPLFETAQLLSEIRI